MKKERTKKIVYIIATFILLAISLRFFIQQLDNFTGVATVQTATVTVNVSKVLPVQPFGSGSKSAQQSTVKEGLRIEPIDVTKAFTISTFVGEKESRQFYVKNLGDLPTDIVVTSTLNIITFDPVKTRLTPGEETAIGFSINTEKPGIFAGKIIVEGTFVTREIPVAITIRSRETNLVLEAKVRSKIIPTHGEIITDIKLRETEVGAVDLEYTLRDANNKALIKITEKRAIRYAAALTKRMRLPADLKPGTYVFAIEARYNGKTSMFSELVTVTQRPTRERPQQIESKFIHPIILIIALISVIVLNIFFLKKKSRL